MMSKLILTKGKLVINYYKAKSVAFLYLKKYEIHNLGNNSDCAECLIYTALHITAALWEM